MFKGKKGVYCSFYSRNKEIVTFKCQPKIHAEEIMIKWLNTKINKLGKRFWRRYRNCWLLVYRMNKLGEVGLAKPCISCSGQLRRFAWKLCLPVVWTQDDTQYETCCSSVIKSNFISRGMRPRLSSKRKKHRN